MKRWSLVLINLFVFTSAVLAQEINFYGYVKTDMYYDSRQTGTGALREGQFLLWPLNYLPDSKGGDLNAKPNYNMLAIQTRLDVGVKGPDALGAQTSGLIEGEFFGTSDADMNGFRLRHAFVNLDWGSTVLMVGQYWHPMFVVDVYPMVVSFNTGAPFQPFSRNPQVRITQKFGYLNLIGTLASQRDFSSFGPGGGSSTYLRNAVVPDADFQVQYKSPDLILGAGVDYKSLLPRVSTTAVITGVTHTLSTSNEIHSLAGIGYFKYKASDWSFAAEAVYGGNLADFLMLGGYGTRSVDPATGAEDYANINVSSVWADFSFGKEWQPGVFVGWTKNQGSQATVLTLTSTQYQRVSNIDNMTRISPRLLFNSGKVRLALEVEITSADYGEINNKAEVINTHTVTNMRVLGAVYYFFGT
jgi:hypothetical protein